MGVNWGFGFIVMKVINFSKIHNNGGLIKVHEE